MVTMRSTDHASSEQVPRVHAESGSLTVLLLDPARPAPTNFVFIRNYHFGERMERIRVRIRYTGHAARAKLPYPGCRVQNSAEGKYVHQQATQKG